MCKWHGDLAALSECSHWRLDRVSPHQEMQFKWAFSSKRQLLRFGTTGCVRKDPVVWTVSNPTDIWRILPGVWENQREEVRNQLLLSTSRSRKSILTLQYLSLIPFFQNSSHCHQTSSGALVPTTVFFRSAVCMPNSCYSDDLSPVFNQIFDGPFTACGAYCSRYPVTKDSAFWGYSIFLIVMISVAILATSVDYIREAIGCDKNQKNRLLDILLAFSLWTNAAVILSVKEQKPGFIKSLDCIRFLSMLWVVSGHTESGLMFPGSNCSPYISWISIVPDVLLPITGFFKHFWNHLLLNAFVSVDTFFLLSGIVVAYMFFKTRLMLHQIKSPVTWILFYVHRFLRLTPPYMIFLGFYIVYSDYIQGPTAAVQLSEFGTHSPAMSLLFRQSDPEYCFVQEYLVPQPAVHQQLRRQYQGVLRHHVVPGSRHTTLPRRSCLPHRTLPLFPCRSRFNRSCMQW